jgi:hypothetical protein
MKRLRSVATASIVLGLVLIYVAGVGIRRRYGIRVVVRNSSAQVLRDVQLTVLDSGSTYSLPDLPREAAGTRYVEPKTESHVDLLFLDEHGARHSATVVGYAEQGYCGKVSVEIRENNRVTTQDGTSTHCFGGWFDFL